MLVQTAFWSQELSLEFFCPPPKIYKCNFKVKKLTLFTDTKHFLVIFRLKITFSICRIFSSQLSVPMRQQHLHHIVVSVASSEHQRRPAAVSLPVDERRGVGQQRGHLGQVSSGSRIQKPLHHLPHGAQMEARHSGCLDSKKWRSYKCLIRIHEQNGRKSMIRKEHFHMIQEFQYVCVNYIQTFFWGGGGVF